MTPRLRHAFAALAVLTVGLAAPATALGPSRAASSPGHLTQGPRDILEPRSHAQRGPEQLTYHGGLKRQGVQHHPAVYLVFWGSQWDRSDPYIDYEVRFFRGLYGAGDDWTGLQREWCDDVVKDALSCPGSAARIGRPYGNLVKGVWFDDSALAVPNDNPFITVGPDAVAKEAVRAAEHFGNTTPLRNRDAQYIINEPSHFDSIGYGLFCAYHSYVGTSYGNIPYTDLPHVTDLGFDCGTNAVNSGEAGRYDGVSIIAGHEFIETISDPYVNYGWLDPDGEENADKCAWLTEGPGAMDNVHLSTGTFAVQGTWSNLSNNGKGGCRLHLR